MSTRAAVQSELTLTGEVTRSFGQHVIQLGTSPPDPVLLVFRTPHAFRLGVPLEVSGHTRVFERAEIEGELGLDLGSEVVGLDGQSCLIVAAVRVL